MRETSRGIADWAGEVFGIASGFRTAARANEEMAELLTKVAKNEDVRSITEECADVAIILIILCYRLGGDLFEAVDDKMRVNRARSWVRDGTGCGYHTKP